MKKEMIKFVEENFEVIKNQFSTFEYETIDDISQCEGLPRSEKKMLKDCLKEGLNSAIDSVSLIDLINERSLGVDYDDEDDANKLFDMIKAIKEATN
jgi:hypothetical protein